jgi:hexokinase
MKTTKINHVEQFINEQKEKNESLFIGFTISLPAILAVMFAIIDSL